MDFSYPRFEDMNTIYPDENICFSDITESQLYVPPDPIDSIPSFFDDVVSLIGFLPSPEPETLIFTEILKEPEMEKFLQGTPTRLSENTEICGSNAEKKKRQGCRRGTRVMALKSKPERKCSHCAAEKTPLWRIGPLGPNTLCNACGLRYKVGKLLPEYRPVASPSFDAAKHSNFHKKILGRKRDVN